MGEITTSMIYEEVHTFATQKLEEKFSDSNPESREKVLEYMIPKSTENIIQFTKITGYELARVLSYVEKTEIDSRVDLSHIYMIPSVVLCQKLGINEGFAMNIKRCFDFMHIINEGNYLPQDCMMLNEQMVDQVLSGETRTIFLENVDKKINIDQITEILFLVHDYKDLSGCMVFSPEKAFEEFSRICGESWVGENKKQLTDMCKFFVEEWSKEGRTGSLDLYQDLFSPEGMKRYMNRYSIRAIANNQEQLDLYKKMYECGGIDRDPTEYHHYMEMSLSDLGLQDESVITEIQEGKSLDYQDRYRDVILRKILNDRSRGYNEIDVKRPRDIEGYTDEIFFTHRKELLKDVHAFAQDILLDQKATPDHITGISLLKTKIDSRLTHMNGLITFLEDCGKIEEKNQSEIFSRIRFLWQQIINRPYAIQQKFFNVSHQMMYGYKEAYKGLLEQLGNVSKQNRKHIIQDMFPELDIILGLVQSMKVKTDKENEEKSPYTDQIMKFIQKIMDLENKENIESMKGEFLDELKRKYIQTYFHLIDPNEYMQEDTEMTEYFLRYGNNINEADHKKLAQIGRMLSLHHHGLWKQRRVDHDSEIPDMTEEGKDMFNQGKENEMKEYRENTIPFDQLLTLQDTTDFSTVIKPQTTVEKIFTIQESFESIFDPDIYEEEVKPLAKSLFGVSDKSVVIQGLQMIENTLVEKMPIVKFITEIEDLHLKEIQRELGTQPSGEKIQQAKNIINQAREIFKNIVKEYKKVATPESVDIRLEEVANNFSLEIDECERSTSAIEGYEQEVRVTSRITTDMQEVIVNIRGCLGCMSKAGSNHKNLDFEYPNRFFMVSYPDGLEQKSIADQILLLLPSDAGLSLVLDSLYGFRSLDILLNHSLHAIKKAQTITEPLNICIPKSTIQSAGTNMATYLQALQGACSKEFPQVKIDTQTIQIDDKYTGYHECFRKDKSEECILISLG